jgi:hypothetical protein
MKDKKININRTKLTSAEIEEKRNFDQLMLQLKTPPTPYYASLGFWGKTGMAGLVILFVVKSISTLFNQYNEDIYDKNITQLKTQPSLPQDTKCLKPISSENDIAFIHHQVVSGEKSEITLEDGTKLEIPANAFDAKKGEIVQITTRLFNDKTSAFLAGVPMDYQESAFESAGMMEIRGEINGKVAQINPDAPIVVHMNMLKHPEGFDFYALDDAKGQWKLHPAIMETELQLPEEVKESDILKLRADLKDIQIQKADLEEKAKKLKMPSEREYFIAKNEHLQFKLDFDKNLFPELSDFTSIVFEALPNQYNYSRVVRKSWDDFHIIKDGSEFIATFSDESASESIKVRPVLKGRELENALRRFEQAKKNYFDSQTQYTSSLESLEKKEKEKIARIGLLSSINEQKELLTADSKTNKAQILKRQKQAVASKLMTATATFKTTKWGVFNADKPVAYPDQFKTPVQFVAEDYSSEDIDCAYVFDMKKDVRYSFGSNHRSIESLGINDNQTIIMVLYKNGDMGYTETSRSALEKTNGRIQLTPLPAEKISEEQIKSILHEGRFSA